MLILHELRDETSQQGFSGRGIATKMSILDSAASHICELAERNGRVFVELGVSRKKGPLQVSLALDFEVKLWLEIFGLARSRDVFSAENLYLRYVNPPPSKPSIFELPQIRPLSAIREPLSSVAL